MQDNGFVFLLGLLGFFFLLWLLGGGPNNQISKSGIFITPASPETTQQGYGPKPTVNETVTLPGNGSVTVQSNPNGTAPKSAPSIPSVSFERSTQTVSANPTQAYLEFIVTSHNSSAVNLKGWKFVSTTSGNATSISSDVTLKSGTSILVVTSFPNTSTHDTMQLTESDGTVVATTSF